MIRYRHNELTAYSASRLTTAWLVAKIVTTFPNVYLPRRKIFVSNAGLDIELNLKAPRKEERNKYVRHTLLLVYDPHFTLCQV